jgi:enoyl-CoA hydratase/carnithine racemase
LANEVLYEKKGHVVIITLNRPEAMNAFNPAQIQAFSEAGIKFKDDPDAWVAIVTGSGNKAFSSGFDLKTMDASGDRLPSPGGDAPKLIQRGLEIYKPIIAAINGVAMGGGLEVVLACDIRIAAEHVKLAVPEVKWNLIPGWGGTQRLPRQIGRAKASEMLLMGTSIDAQEALRVGLINKIVPADKLMEEAMAWAQKIAENGPLSVRAAKQCILQGTDMTLQDGMQLELDLVDKLLDTEDSREGPRAFAEKRKPNFKGK